MQSLAPTFTVNADLEHGEVHYSATGLFDMDTIVDFQRELIARSRPLLERGEPFCSLGDLRGLVTQTKDVADAIRVIVVESQKLGVVRTAIVADNLLAKMQYKRLNEGINLEIFDNKSDAVNWLRAKD